MIMEGRLDYDLGGNSFMSRVVSIVYGMVVPLIPKLLVTLSLPSIEMRDDDAVDLHRQYLPS